MKTSSTQWCRFLSQEVRENHSHFIALTARVSPLRLGKREIQIFTHKFSPLRIEIRPNRQNRNACMMKQREGSENRKAGERGDIDVGGLRDPRKHTRLHQARL